MDPKLGDQVEIIVSRPKSDLHSGDRGTIIGIPEEGNYEVEFQVNEKPITDIIPQDQLYVVRAALGGKEISLEEQISQVMDGLPEKDLREILGWARFLKSRSTQEKNRKSNSKTSKSTETLRSIDLFIVGTSYQCSKELQTHQLGLQEMFGGRLIEPVHYTIQRFRFFEEERLQDFRDELKQSLRNILPFPVQAQNIVTLYSEYRRARVLKWHINLTSELQNVADLVEKLLNLHKGKSMLPSRWISDLITALEDIQDMGFQRNLQLIPVPDPLFKVEQLILAQFTNQQDFKILEEFPLNPGT
jgi:hypothetical protein